MSLDSDASLTMRTLGTSIRILVGSPALASRIGCIEDLSKVPLLATDDAVDEVIWQLETDAGARQSVRGPARMGCADFGAMRAAARRGLGVALLPDHVCRTGLAEGSLARVLPEWRGQKGTVHLVFTTRRGLPPAVRLFIDHLARGFPRDALSVEGA